MGWTCAPKMAKTPQRSIIVRDVRDNDGNKLGTITEPYDGTEQDARSAAERLSNRMYEQYPDASNVESRIVATDAGGKPKWIISPNFRHIAEIRTDQARYIWGDIEATAIVESPTVKAFKVKGYVLHPKTGAWEKPGTRIGKDTALFGDVASRVKQS